VESQTGTLEKKKGRDEKKRAPRSGWAGLPPAVGLKAKSPIDGGEIAQQKGNTRPGHSGRRWGMPGGIYGKTKQEREHYEKVSVLGKIAGGKLKTLTEKTCVSDGGSGGGRYGKNPCASRPGKGKKGDRKNKGEKNPSGGLPQSRTVFRAKIDH